MIPLEGYIMPLIFVTPSELQFRIAEKYRLVRLAQNLSRTTLGMRSGVSPETIKRFESKAEISLTSLVRLTFSLGLESELQILAAFAPPQTLAELDRLEKNAAQTRKRGRR